MKKIFNKKNRGMTIVETVVAVAIVVIVSTIAFSICNVSINNGHKNKLQNFFICQTQNYVKAYYQGEDDYSTSMELLTGEAKTFGENTKIYYSSDLNITTEQNSKYVVNIRFDDGFSVECLDSNSNLIYGYEVWYEFKQKKRCCTFDCFDIYDHNHLNFYAPFHNFDGWHNF